MDRQLIFRSFAWTAAVTSVFILAISAAILSWIVGDWTYIHTQEAWLAWLCGIFVLLGFVVSLGVGVGVVMWLRQTKDEARETVEYVPAPSVSESMSNIITAVAEIPRD